MKIEWSRGTDFWSRLQGWLYPQIGLWKWRSTYHFVKNSAYSVLKIELLLTMLFNFDGEVSLKDSAFWWVACLTHKVLWSVYSLIINLIGLACHIVWYISNTCGGVWLNGVGQARKSMKNMMRILLKRVFSWLG